MAQNQVNDAYAYFIHRIATSKDLPMEQKIKILEYSADEYFIKDRTLMYLECKSLIKDLRGQK